MPPSEINYSKSPVLRASEMVWLLRLVLLENPGIIWLTPPATLYCAAHGLAKRLDFVTDSRREVLAGHTLREREQSDTLIPISLALS